MRLIVAQKHSHSVSVCPNCKRPHLRVKRDPQNKFATIIETKDAEGHVEEKPLYPHKIKEIFDRVPDSAVEALGKSPSSHPRHFVMRVLRISPTTIRPDVRKLVGGRSSNDKLTTILRTIIKAHNKKLTEGVNLVDIDAATGKNLYDIMSMIYEIILGGNDDTQTYAQRLKGKKGRFRGSQLGKRCHAMARSTVVGDPRLAMDQISIPDYFARTLQVRETVQAYNRDRLMVFVRNGRRQYPGCSRVTKWRTGVDYMPDKMDSLVIEDGDVITRDLMNGDLVGFNRQPSLTLSSITAKKVVVDPGADVIGMNVLVCPYFNADFDGDQMNIINYSDLASLNEVRMLSATDAWIVSPTTSAPITGQRDDSLIGTFELTLPEVVFDRYHALLLFQNTLRVPNLHGVDSMSGREVVSVVLREAPFDYRGSCGFFNPSSPWAQWAGVPRPDNATIKITRGTLESGCLDKGALGAGGIGNIFHTIFLEHGARKTLDTMFNIQQLAIAYILQHGFTVGIMDLILKHEQREEIERVASDIMSSAWLNAERLNRGEIIPPIGKTVEQFYEEQQINTLKILDDFAESLIRGIDPETNGLFRLQACGSKGSMTNLHNMISIVGQTIINAERIRQRFGYRRTLPYFPRFDVSPESRGYISNSFVTGLRSWEYIFNAMGARFDLIAKALMTSVTGAQSRTSTKNLESITINNYKWAVKDDVVVQFAYGGDCFDPRFVEPVRIGSVLVSDAVLEEKFHYKAVNPSAQGVFDREFEQVKRDRATYRAIYKTLEDMNVRERLGNVRRMCFNVESYLNAVVATAGKGAGSASGHSDETMLRVVKLVGEFVDNMPYFYINGIQEAARGWVPPNVEMATTVAKIYVRSDLCAKRVGAVIPPSLGGKATVAIVEAVLDRIRLSFARAIIDSGLSCGIIAAQSFSEPFTQDMLDSHKYSAEGKSVKIKSDKCKEVMAAYDVDRLSVPIMTVPLTADAARSRETAQAVAVRLEVLVFEQLVSSTQIFSEQFGKPRHPRYAAEGALIDGFLKANPLMKPGANLANWCLRFELNKSTLVLKNISTGAIAAKMREAFPDAFFMYTTERARTVFFRVYPRASMISRAHGAEVSLEAIRRAIMRTVVRGIRGIRMAKAEKLVRTKIAGDGSVVNDDIWGVATVGTNLAEVAMAPGVDSLRVLTDAIQETARVLGIEAARQRIISELRQLVEKCNYRHFTIYADEMTRTGRVTSIERSGLDTREKANIGLRVGFGAPIQTLTEAALNTCVDSVTGITGQLLLGSIPRCGTIYNSFSVDPEVVKANRQSISSVIDDL